MAKGKGRRRKGRRRFTTLETGGNVDFAAHLATVGKAHSRSAARADQYRKVEEAPAVLDALRKAEEVAEVYIPSVPSATPPAVVAAAIQKFLNVVDSPRVGKAARGRLVRGTGGSGGAAVAAASTAGEGQGAEKPVMKVTIKPTRGGPRGQSRTSAIVLMRTKRAAELLVSFSPLSLGPLGKAVHVYPSTKVMSGIGAAWGSRSEPGGQRFSIGQVQVGELKQAPNRFSVFWESSKVFDVGRDSHVEINPVSRVIAITLGRPQVMQRACNPRSGGGTAGVAVSTFTSVSAMMRIEIPFHSIVSQILSQEVSKGNMYRSVYLRVSHPPHLFRNTAKSGIAIDQIVRDFVGSPADRDRQVEDLFRNLGERNWDCERGETAPVRWQRTVDPTGGRAFARCSGIRVFLDVDLSADLLVALQNLCLVDRSKPIPAVVPSLRDVPAAEENDFFRAVVRDTYRISFPVRYELACLLSFGALQMSDLGASASIAFWTNLSSLSEKNALRVLNEMHVMAEGEDGYTLLDPVKSLDMAMETMGVFDRDEGAGAQGRDGGDDDNASVASDDTDEDLLETFRRALNLDDDVSSNNSKAIGRPKTRRNGVGIHAGGGDDQQDDFNAAEMGPPPKRSKAESHHAYIRRLLLTPTRTVACRAESDLLNRVLREFKDHKDRFLRVGFADEDGNSIAFVGSPDIFARVRKLLGEGVHVAGEHFVFLAFSSSQLRDHGCWLYNEMPGLFDANPPPTANDIRRWMGDFSMIRVRLQWSKGGSLATTGGSCCASRLWLCLF